MAGKREDSASAGTLNTRHESVRGFSFLFRSDSLPLGVCAGGRPLRAELLRVRNPCVSAPIQLQRGGPTEGGGAL